MRIVTHDVHIGKEPDSNIIWEYFTDGDYVFMIARDLKKDYASWKIYECQHRPIFGYDIDDQQDMEDSLQKCIDDCKNYTPADETTPFFDGSPEEKETIKFIKDFYEHE